MGKGLKWFFIILGILVLVSLGSLLIRFVLFPFFVANKVADTTEGVISKTLNADNVLFNYENFKNMHEGAKQQVMNIAKANASLKSLKDTYGADATKWPKDVRDQAAFLQQNIDGYNMQYQSIVSRYNADSKKLNRNLFKDKSLPYELPLDPTQLDLNQ